MDEYWLKQTISAPLFEDLLWSRPENRRSAGKLLIIGGNGMGFAAVQQAYAEADRAGAGTIRVLLPEALHRTVGHALEAAEFAASTAVSGGFAKESLGEMLLQAEWADAVLIAGDLGRNSETSIALEGFVNKYAGPLIVTNDAADYFMAQPELLAGRPDTALIISPPQLQALGTSLSFETPFISSMGLLLLVQALHSFTERHQPAVITRELDQIVVSYKGRVSSTKLSESGDSWQTKTAAHTAVWLMQNPGRPFEAATTAMIASEQ